MHENDALADKLFQASLDVSHGHNIQALHDLGYQTLHGFGTAQDNGKAYETLLTKAAAGMPPALIIDYMKLHHLVLAALEIPAQKTSDDLSDGLSLLSWLAS